MEEYAAICDLTLDRMKQISSYIQDQMEKGLKGERSDLKMLVSFVDSVCTGAVRLRALSLGTEQGFAMALDMGGTNIRATKYLLRGNGVLEVIKEVKHAFPPEYMSGTADQVFGFLADCVVESNPEPGTKLGFTFSYPCEQTAINHSTLVEWTKGFSATGCVGHDCVALLEKALAKRNCQVKVTATCNDTVGTLISRSYSDPYTAVGIILGTGCNAAYMEKVSRIEKTKVDSRSGKMIINMECGGVGDNNPSILPQLPFDVALDPITPNPTRQHLEKMMSGMYLGELSRMWAVQLWKDKMLFRSHPGNCEFFTTPMSVDSKYCSLILGDNTPTLEEVKRILLQFDIKESTQEDRELLRQVVFYIVRRSARLMSSFIHAIYTHMGSEFNDRTVGVDGSVYKLMPFYQTWVAEGLEELGRRDIEIGLADDGSSIGAALIAFNARES